MDNKQGLNKSTDNTKSEAQILDKREELNQNNKPSVGISKEGLSISTKIVESGINLVEIHNELTQKESKNVVVSCRSKEVIADSKDKLNNLTLVDNNETKPVEGIRKTSLENKKEELDISLKIVESGKQMVVINNEVTKTANTNTLQQSTNSNVAENNEKLNKAIRNVESGKQTMMDNKGEMNKTTKAVEQGKQSTDDKKKKTSVENKKEDSEISSKIVESGKQIVVINNELTKTKAANTNNLQQSTNSIVAENNDKSNKIIRNNESGKQTMMDTKGEFNKIRNAVENGKQSLDDKKNKSKISPHTLESGQPLTNEKKEDSDKHILTGKKQKTIAKEEFAKNNEKLNITRKIIESGKQFLGINNKLAMPNNSSSKNLKGPDVELNIKDVVECSDQQKGGEEEKNEKDSQPTKTIMETPICFQEPDKSRLREKFKLFSKFGDKSSDGSTIKLSQSDKWFKQAGVIKPRGISTTDTAIAFRKISKRALKLSFVEWNQYLCELARAKQMDVNTIKTQLVGCEEPGWVGAKKEARVVAVAKVSQGSRSGLAHKQDYQSFSKENKKENLRRGWRL